MKNNYIFQNKNNKHVARTEALFYIFVNHFNVRLNGRQQDFHIYLYVHLLQYHMSRSLWKTQYTHENKKDK